MENLLKMVEEPSLVVADIDADKLKFFTAKVKIWDNASLSLKDCQKLSVEDRSSILQKCYVDMWARYTTMSRIYFPFFVCEIYVV